MKRFGDSGLHVCIKKSEGFREGQDVEIVPLDHLTELVRSETKRILDSELEARMTAIAEAMRQ